jgi:hypothetical protein
MQLFESCNSNDDLLTIFSDAFCFGAIRHLLYEISHWFLSSDCVISTHLLTLGILGFQKFGSQVARRANGLGIYVIAHDPYASADRARHGSNMF